MDQKLYPPRQDRHIEEFAEYDFSVEMGRHERLELERELLRRKILYTLPSYVFLRSDGEEMGYTFSEDMPVLFEDFEVVYQV